MNFKIFALIVLLFSIVSFCMAWELSGTTLVNIKARAEKGIASAQDSIGFNCEARPALNEEEGKQKATEAFSWFQKAAAQGYASAQYHLGLCYDDGIGTESNYTNAFNNFQLAADQGFAPGKLSKQREFVLSKQLLRSGTSIGALIREAEFGQSKADFVHKLNIALKEANETEYWLLLLHDTDLLSDINYNELAPQCREIIRMLAASVKTLNTSNS